MFGTHRRLLSLLLVLAFATPAWPTCLITGVPNPGGTPGLPNFLYTYDPASSYAETAIGGSMPSLTGYNGLARDPTTNILYAIHHDTFSNLRTLNTVNETTGVLTQIGSELPSTSFIASITFKNDGTLVGISGFGSPTVGRLWTIDTSTAALTDTGHSLTPTVSGTFGGVALATEPHTGKIYYAYMDDVNGFVHFSIVDPTTYAEGDIGPTDRHLAVGALVFVRGVLYFSTTSSLHQLFTVNLGTLTMTQVKIPTFGLKGLAGCIETPPTANHVLVGPHTCTGGNNNGKECSGDRDCTGIGTCTGTGNNSVRDAVTGTVITTVVAGTQVTFDGVTNTHQVKSGQTCVGGSNPDAACSDASACHVCITGQNNGHHCTSNGDCTGGGTCDLTGGCSGTLADSFDSGSQAAPFTFTHTFNTPGVYPYLDPAHVADDMQGVIVVRAANTGGFPVIDDFERTSLDSNWINIDHFTTGTSHGNCGIVGGTLRSITGGLGSGECVAYWGGNATSSTNTYTCGKLVGTGTADSAAGICTAMSSSVADDGDPDGGFISTNTGVCCLTTFGGGANTGWALLSVNNGHLEQFDGAASPTFAQNDYIGLTRTGDTYQCWRSPDGMTWTAYSPNEITGTVGPSTLTTGGVHAEYLGTAMSLENVQMGDGGLPTGTPCGVTTTTTTSTTTTTTLLAVCGEKEGDVCGGPCPEQEICRWNTARQKCACVPKHKDCTTADCEIPSGGLYCKKIDQQCNSSGGFCHCCYVGDHDCHSNADCCSNKCVRGECR